MRVETVVSSAESDFNDTILRMASVLRRDELDCPQLSWTISKDPHMPMNQFADFLKRNSRARHELESVRVDCGFVQGKFGVDME